MRCSIALAVLGLLSACAGSPTPERHDVEQRPLAVAVGTHVDDGDGARTTTTSLVDVLSSDPDYSLLIRLLQRSRLITTLNKINGTLFAPTNAAVRAAIAAETEPTLAVALDEGVGPLADNIQARLRATLLYHTVNRTLSYNVSASGPKGVDMVETLLLPHPDEGTGRPGEPPERPGPPDSLLGGEGQRLRLTRRENTTVVGVDALGAGGVAIVKTAVAAHNGVVVGIDRMLEPPKSLRASRDK